MITSKNKCTGCMACFQVCPSGAIDIIKDELGFEYPKINKEKCTNCNLCKKICPAEKFEFENTINPICQAAMAQDELRKESSSGGIFSVLADEFLNFENSVVIGCTNANDLKTEHIAILKKEDLYKLRGSKYVQSDTKYVFKKTKEFLDQDKKVLFSGTPCQIAGLYSFLRNKPENLITIEIMCHGVSSRDIFDKYIKEEFKDEKPKELSFRDKTNGWNYNLTLRVSKNGKEEFIPYEKSSYFKLFLDAVSLRESCHDCKFAKMPRVADITLGDFWEINQYDSSLNDGLGTSMVLLNTEKGTNLYNSIKPKLKLSKETPLEAAKIGNQTLKYPTPKSPLRQEFLKNYNKMSLKENLDCLKKFKFDCAILNFWWTNNYGATLTAYALQQLLQKLNYTSVLVKYIFAQSVENDYYNGLSNKFEREHLVTSRLYYSPDELSELNKITDKFIVGSDQVFRYEYMKDSFLLDFADFEKTKIGFSASFGVDSFNNPKSSNKKYEFLFSRFDDISTRELSGIDICKNRFNIKAKQIIDPVFALDISCWGELISESKLKNKKYILFYVLDKSEELSNKISTFAKEKALPILEIKKEDCSIQDWLYLIKNAEYIITDSYHGLCFSLIFNKNVKCVANISRGAERFVSLQKLLNFPDDIFITDEIEAVNFKDIDYSKINKYIEINKQKCIEHLAFVMKIKKETDEEAKKRDIKLQKKYSKNISGFKRFKYKVEKILYKILYKLFKKQKFYEKYETYKARLK